MDTSVAAPLRLALIGMSGAGKTFWTKRLSAGGYPGISCDDRIEERLRAYLSEGGHAGINGVAAWMGWPDNPSYAQREAEYLAAEISTLDEILSDLEQNPGDPCVLDTTGSVIYTGNNLLLRLRRQVTVVYLAASPEEQQLLVERYLKDPKPVLWRGAFQPRAGETPRQTVLRCYPSLLEARRRSYEALAHSTLAVSDLRQISSRQGPRAASEFLEKIQAHSRPAR
jgi:shikimate kinase